MAWPSTSASARVAGCRYNASFSPLPFLAVICDIGFGEARVERGFLARADVMNGTAWGQKELRMAFSVVRRWGAISVHNGSGTGTQRYRKWYTEWGCG